MSRAPLAAAHLLLSLQLLFDDVLIFFSFCSFFAVQLPFGHENQYGMLDLTFALRVVAFAPFLRTVEKKVNFIIELILRPHSNLPARKPFPFSGQFFLAPSYHHVMISRAHRVWISIDSSLSSFLTYNRRYGQRRVLIALEIYKIIHQIWSPSQSPKLRVKYPSHSFLQLAVASNPCSRRHLDHRLLFYLWIRSSVFRVILKSSRDAVLR